MRYLASSRPAAFALLLATGVFAVCAVEYTFHLSGGLRNVLNDWVYDNLFLAAGAACIVRGIVYRRDRLAWILMGAAVAAWGIGDTIWTFAIADNPNAPFPSIADIGFLAVYPLAYASILLLLRSRAGTLRGSLWLDGVIGGLAVAAVGAAVVFQAVLDTIGGSPAAVATNLAYPLADVTLIALVVWALAVTGWHADRTWALLAGGLLVFSVSDCLYLYDTATGSYVSGARPTSAGWPEDYCSRGRPGSRSASGHGPRSRAGPCSSLRFSSGSQRSDFSCTTTSTGSTRCRSGSRARRSWR